MANTTRATFRTNILRNLGNKTGAAAEAFANIAINNAMRIISRAHVFPELLIQDTSNALTVIDQKEYHLVDDLGLTRPQHIYSIKYMDTTNSRKLRFIDSSAFDADIPYPEGWSSGKPTSYTRFGNTLTLFRIPDAAKSLYIRYSQRPLMFSNDVEECSYENIDDVIEALATSLTFVSYEEDEQAAMWMTVAKTAFVSSIQDDHNIPDRRWKAEAFDPTKNDSGSPSLQGEYWANPFVQQAP